MNKEISPRLRELEARIMRSGRTANILATIPGDQSLLKLEAAKQTLADCKTLPDIVKIRDQAIAAETYAKAAKLSAESVAYATEIKLLAERRAGEVLATLEKGNRIGSSTPLEVPTPYREAVNKADISKDQAARWQKLAKLDDKEIQAKIERVKQASVNGVHMTKAKSPLSPAGDIKAAVYHVFETSQKEMKRFETKPEQQKFKTATLEFLKNKLIPSTPVVTKRTAKNHNES